MLGLGKALRGLEARLEAKSSTILLKVKETVTLRPDASMRAATPVICHDHAGPMQWRHLKVFNKECSIVCALSLGGLGDDNKVYLVIQPGVRRTR